MNLKETMKGMGTSLRAFAQQCRRVLLVSSKPDKDEFQLSAKITGIGMIIIGVVGFIIFMAFQLAGLS